MADLSKICVRAPIDPDQSPVRWESTTLEELFDTGRAGFALEWALGKLDHIVRVDGVHLTKENLAALVDVVESLGAYIVKLK